MLRACAPLALVSLLLATACGGAKEAPPAAPPAPTAAPEAASAKAVDPDDKPSTELPTACAEGDDKICMPPKAFVKRLCAGFFPDAALIMFKKGTPWTRGYLRLNVEAWNASGGMSSSDKLVFDEEVLLVAHRSADTGGMTVSGASGSYDVLRWDGTCASLMGEEVTTKLAPAPKHAKILEEPRRQDPGRAPQRRQDRQDRRRSQEGVQGRHLRRRQPQMRQGRRRPRQRHRRLRAQRRRPPAAVEAPLEAANHHDHRQRPPADLGQPAPRQHPPLPRGSLRLPQVPRRARRHRPRSHGRVPAHPHHLPEIAHEALVQKDSDFVKGFGLSLFGRPLLGNGLLTSEGETHRRQRKLMAPAFVQKRISEYATEISARTEKAQQAWSDGATVDVAAAMMHLTLEIVGKTLFDTEIGSDAVEIGEALTLAMEHIIGSLSSLVPIPPTWPTPRNRKNQQAIARLDQIVYRLIREHREGGRDRGDFLSMLLLAQDEDDGSGMTDKQVRDEAMTIVLAGHETTANALSWTFYLLAQHPEIRARLEREVDAVLGGRSPAIADLPGSRTRSRSSRRRCGSTRPRTCSRAAPCATSPSAAAPSPRARW